MNSIEKRRKSKLLYTRKKRAYEKNRLEGTIPLINIDSVINNCRRATISRTYESGENASTNQQGDLDDSYEDQGIHENPNNIIPDQMNENVNVNNSDMGSDGESDEDFSQDNQTDHDEDNSSEESDEDFDVNYVDQNRAPEIQQLKEWAIRNKIPHVHVSSLLMILRQRLLPELPRSSKTFLGTTKATYHVVNMQDADTITTGEFTYIGIEQGLKKCVNVDAHQDGIVKLQFNCDGLPLSTSSYKSAWPILCKVHNHLAFYQPFVVAIYVGRSKPLHLWKYLRQFIQELNALFINGFVLNVKRLRIELHSFICDTPARAFLKVVAGHTGFHACERCDTIGIRVDNTTVFPNVGNMRTDESFRRYDDIDHHISESQLTKIRPIVNMVNSFVLDFMHLGFLGVMSKLLEYWFSERGNKVFRTSQIHKDEVSRRLQSIRKQIPYEFSRKIRTLLEFSRYKATELKFFALYAGPIVLKDMLSDKQYENYLFFHFATRILWHRRTALLRENVNKAKNLYEIFFDELKKLYTEKAAVMNMHNINHVSDDVLHMKCSLSEMTAFPFENLLGKIKRLLRSPTRTAAQLCRRLHEYDILNNQAPLLYEVHIIKENNKIIKRLKYREAILTTHAPDNMVLLQNNHIFQIKNIYRDERGNDILVEGLRWNIKDHIYNYPQMKSGELNSWELKKPTTDNVVTFPVNNISIKMAMFTLKFVDESTEENKFFAMPLLHG